ncbi:MAG: hypothetical protein ACYDBH_01415 [Acidobacteriaceae bacterium]
MTDETMTLEQVRDRLRTECEHVEKDSMKYAECAYQVPAWVLSDLADAIETAIAERGKVPELQSMSEAVTDKELQDAMDTWGGYWGCCSDNNVAGSYREAVRLTLEAFAAERGKVPEWQPIETAPTKGRKLILLLLPDGNPPQADRWPQVAFSNSWWTGGFPAGGRPTHWMPLPAIPKVTP